MEIKLVELIISMNDVVNDLDRLSSDKDPSNPKELLDLLHDAISDSALHSLCFHWEELKRYLLHMHRKMGRDLNV